MRRLTGYRSSVTTFDRARQVSAAEVARKAGIQLRKHGNRFWSCCPAHSEKTPSCCFFPDGRWWCFGCHQGGDAIDLFAVLYRVTKKEAAERLSAGDYVQNLPDRKQLPLKSDYLSGRDREGYSWGQLCTLKHRASEIMETAQGDDLWNTLKIRSEIENRLDQILEDELWNH